MSKLQLHRRLISLHHVCQNITPRHVPVSLLSHFSHVNYHLIFNSVFSGKERRSKTASIMFTSITANQKTEIKPDEIAGLQMTKRCFCFVSFLSPSQLKIFCTVRFLERQDKCDCFWIWPQWKSWHKIVVCFPNHDDDLKMLTRMVSCSKTHHHRHTHTTRHWHINPADFRYGLLKQLVTTGLLS